MDRVQTLGDSEPVFDSKSSDEEDPDWCKTRRIYPNQDTYCQTYPERRVSTLPVGCEQFPPSMLDPNVVANKGKSRILQMKLLKTNEGHTLESNCAPN